MELTRLALRLVAAALLLAVPRPAWAARSSSTSSASSAPRYHSLADLAAAYGLKMTAGKETVVLSSSRVSLTFYPKSARALVNTSTIWLNYPCVAYKGGWAIHSTDKTKWLDPLMRPKDYLAAYRVRTIVLDPGHGGDDPGAIGSRGRAEKTIILDLAQRLRSKLANAGYKVYLTRDTDRTVELEDRPARAKRYGADVFVSLHLNSGAWNAYGIETYALTSSGCPSTGSERTPSTAYAGNRHDAANTILAYYVHKSLRTSTGASDRGIRRARFAVLRDASCPAVLVECGFISHAKTLELLRSTWYLDRIAQGIADGIVGYAKLVDSSRPAPRK